MLHSPMRSLFLVVASGLWLVSRTPRTVETYTDVARDPNVSPDYFGTVIPANIAPLNFRVLEPEQAYLARIYAARAE
jgi:hypothetical protein